MFGIELFVRYQYNMHCLKSQHIDRCKRSIPNKYKILYGENMDRRQKKTREAIFHAFCELLSKKQYHQITVGEIIERADVGRATFYAHFETKDFLLKELCEELFCHIFDAMEEGNEKHRHIFACDAPSSVFLHLLQHLQKNDHNILDLLTCENNEPFLRYFKESLTDLITKKMPGFFEKKPGDLPDAFWINHISATFVEIIRWWIADGKKESAEALSHYFNVVIFDLDINPLEKKD